MSFEHLDNEQLAYYLLQSGASKVVHSIKNETASDIAQSQGKIHFCELFLNICSKWI